MLVAKPRMQVVEVKSKADTYDIVQEILQMHTQYWQDTCNLAKKLSQKFKGEKLLKAIWNIARNRFTYKTDPLGTQYVKRPAVLWQTREGDCKSYSLFIGSLLQCLRIPFKYRFVAYRGQTPTHVYVVAKLNDKEVIIDGTIPRFNYEKPYTFKIDYDMTRLYRIEGGKSGMLDLGDEKRLDKMTEGELELRIAKQRLEIERDIVAEMRGIGSNRVKRYDDILEVINDAIKAAERGDPDEIEIIAYQALRGEYNDTELLQGIGDPYEIGKIRLFRRRKRRKRRRALRKVFNKVKQAVRKAGRKSIKFLRKAGEKIKKGVKAFAKAVTFLPRTVIKGILEVLLPAAAPWFLYVFVKRPDLLPPKARRKYEKQKKILDLIVQKLGMKRSHVMGIIRNGIMKRFKKSPEAILREMFGSQIAGIGMVGAILAKVPWDAVIPALLQILQKVLGKKIDVSDATPDPSDVADVSPQQAEQIVKDLQQSQSEYVVPDDAGSDQTGGRSRFWTF